MAQKECKLLIPRVLDSISLKNHNSLIQNDVGEYKIPLEKQFDTLSGENIKNFVTMF